MSRPDERRGGPGGGTPSAQHYQFYASWLEGAIPYDVVAQAPAWQRLGDSVVARLRGTRGAAAAFVAPEPDSDAETVAALERGRRNRLPLLVASRGVDFSRTVLLLEHVGAPLTTELDIGHRGDRFTATGWVSPEHASALRACSGVSPRLLVRRARIHEVSPRMFAVDVSECELVELSATKTPAREGTTLMVATHAGVALWEAPGGERFVHTEPPDARWRALNDAGEVQFQSMVADQAEAKD